LRSFIKVFLTGLFLSVVGWGGLALLFVYSIPTLGPRWLFFFLLMLSLSGTALPVVFFLNQRFPSKIPAASNVIVREALMVGVYGNIAAWLQMGRILTGTLAIIIACGFILIEALLRWSEQSRWKPSDKTNA
jgi:hypothetical protein